MEVNNNYNPTKIYESESYIKTIQSIVKKQSRILLVTSKSFEKNGEVKKINEMFEHLDVFSDVKPNPELSEIDSIQNNFKNKAYDFIVALGGGSVIDYAKAFSVALCTSIQNPLYFNLIENNVQTWRESLDLIAIPTTAGTGSEVTPFATIWDKNTKKKYSINLAQLYPKCTILDPALTVSKPYRLTLYTGLDTISHALESLWNINKCETSKGFALKSLSIMNNNFIQLLSNLDSLDLRREVQLASTYSGLAISKTRTAIAHSISYPITMDYNVPHGLACSFTLPVILSDYISEAPTDEAEVLINTQKLLSLIDFSGELSQFVKIEELSKLGDRMFTKERAGNFSMSNRNINHYLIKDKLRS